MPFIFNADRTRWRGNGYDWTAIPSPGPGSAPLSEDYNVIETAEPNPVVADLDGDGFKEILFASYDGKVHAYWVDKTEHGNWPYVIPGVGIRFASEPLVADLDNDGRAEVLFTSWPEKVAGRVGQLHILDYNGNPLYVLDLPPSLGGGWNGALAAPTLADIDGDGELELVVGTVASGLIAYDLPGTSRSRILWGTGRGNMQRTGAPSELVRDDFNGDGKPDILWRHATLGANAVWFMDGTTYSGYAYLPTVTDPSWKIVGTGDFNGDGKVDILWRHATLGANAVWFMDGTTYSGSAYLPTVTDPNWKIVGTGDFNGDGKVDILLHHATLGANAVWFMDGTTYSGSAYLPTLSDPDWKIVGTGNFDGDGKVDILLRHATLGTNAVWFMNGTTFVGSAYLPKLSDPDWRIVGTGDFNGDGQTDILWRHSTLGYNAVWFMNGTTFAGSVYLNSVPDTDWKIGDSE